MRPMNNNAPRRNYPTPQELEKLVLELQERVKRLEERIYSDGK